MATVKTAATFIDGLRRELVRAIAVPPITAAAYANGNSLGSLIEVAVNDSAKEELVLLGLELSDKAKQSAPIDVLIFDTEPTGTTFTDKAALDLVAADLPGHVDTVNLLAASYSALANTSVVAARNLRIPILGPAAANGKFWVAMVARGAATYASVADLTLKLLLSRGRS